MNNPRFAFPAVDTLLTGLMIAAIAVVGGLAIVVYGAQSVFA